MTLTCMILVSRMDNVMLFNFGVVFWSFLFYMQTGIHFYEIQHPIDKFICYSTFKQAKSSNVTHV